MSYSDIPLIDRFSFNIYKMYEHLNQQKNTEWQDAFKDSGWLAEMYWVTKLKQISTNFSLSYIGEMTCGFANKWAEDNYWGVDENGEDLLAGTPSTWQMTNDFFWNSGKWSLSTGVQFNYHADYRDSQEHDAITMYFGLQRKF